MSRNNSYPRNKKSQSAKPYNASNASFVRRLTSRVSGYIPQSLRIGSWFAHPEVAPPVEEDCHSDDATDEEEEEEEFGGRGDMMREAQQRPRLGSLEQSVPPQKRARTDFVSQDEPHFSASNNLSLSAIQTDIAGSSGSGRMELRRLAMATSTTTMFRGLPVPGPSGLHGQAVEGPSGLHGQAVAGPSGLHGQAVAGPSGLHGQAVAGPSGLHGQAVAGPSGLHGQAVAGPSGLQLRPPVASSTPAVLRNQQPAALGRQTINSQVNGDELSDSSESTSGCSSLVPQGGRHDSEQQQQPQRSNPLKRPANCPSRASSSMFEQRSLFSHSGKEVAVPQPAAASKRPTFDVSILSPLSRPASSGDKPNVTNSPFYAGKTCYGGASAYRKSSPRSNMTGISYDSIVNTSLSRSPARNRGLNSSISDVTSPRRIHIAPVSDTPLGVSPTVNTSQSEPSVSSVARRILDTMETLSSPVSDCSQIPLDESGWGSPSSKRRRLPESLYDYKSPRATRPVGPPAVPLPVPTVHELLKMKKMQAKLQDSTEAARKQALKGSKPAWQDTRPAYSLRVDEADGSRHTNKMKRKQKDEEEEYELPEQVNLPNISLTMTGLPTIDLGLGPARGGSDSNPPTGDNPIFTFASPIVVKDISKTPNKNNFKLVSPGPTTVKPLHNISESLKLNWQNSKMSQNFSNIPKGINCVSSSSTSESNKHNKQVNASTPKSSSQESKATTNSFGDMFKPAPGSWECGTCCIRNKSEATVCISCSSECPKSSATSAPASSSATMPSITQLPLSSGFGTQFSRAGKWECDGCFNQNDNAMLKCPSCNTPNPKASNSQAMSSASAVAASSITPPSFGFGPQFKKPDNAWECSVCLVVNKDVAAKQCISCQSYKLGEEPKETLQTSKPLFSFGVLAKDTKTETPSSSSKFKFGIEPDVNVKPPVSGSSFGPAKSFSFGIPATSASTTPPILSTASISAVNSPLFSFGVPQSKPEESTPKPPEKKITFPTENVSFSSPKSNISPSLKRSADSEQKSFQFTAPTSEGTKFMLPVVNDNKQKESSLPVSGFATKNDEPSAKKSFSFTPATPKSTEATGMPAPNFMAGTGSPATSMFPASTSANFVFKPASAVSAASTPSSQAPLFSFGATSGSKSVAGPGFSGPSFGGKPAETKSSLSFGTATKTTETSEPVKFAFGGSSTATPSFGTSLNSSTTPSFGATVPTTANPPAFGASPVTVSSGVPLFGAGSTNTTGPIALFGAPSTTSASSIPSFASSTASPSVPAFGATSATSSTPAVPQFGAAATGNTSIFGSSAGTATSMFGPPSTTAPPAFGAPVTSVTSAPVFGAPVKSVSFADPTKSTNLGASSTTPAQFNFGSKPQTATTNNAPPVYPFGSTPAVGRFSFGSNTGAPVNSTSTFGFGTTANNAIDNKSPFGGGGFGSSSSGFPAVKPAEATSMFGSTAPPGFGGAAAPTPAPAFGAAPQQFGEANTSFQTPNFGFGNNQATLSQTPFGFPASHNSNAGQNAAAPSAFMFGQQQQQQQQQQPAATAAAPPQFNPNIAPSFNFTGGAPPTIFSAPPSTQQNSAGPRRFKKATRRIPQAPSR